MSDVAYMDVKELVNKGYLQEVNRRFFHPLGLALAVEVDEVGDYKIIGVQDYRIDPEGVVFENLNNPQSIKKFETIEAEFKKFLEIRNRLYGFGIQPMKSELK